MKSKNDISFIRSVVKITVISLSSVFVFLCVVFFEKMNSLLTFNIEMETSNSVSQTLEMGWLEILLSSLDQGLTQGLVGTIVSPKVISLLAVSGLVFALMRHIASNNPVSQHYTYGEFPIWIGSYTNRTKLWLLCVFTFAFVDSATNGFDLDYLAILFRFHFNGGASVPTAPWSMTDIGTMIEYFFHVSIKNFFTESKSWLQWVFVVGTVVWCGLKAHTITVTQLSKAKTSKEVVSLIPSSLTGLIISIFAPYRLSKASMRESVDVSDDISKSLKVMRVPDKQAMILANSINNRGSIANLLKDRHGFYLHRVMSATNQYKEQWNNK